MPKARGKNHSNNVIEQLLLERVPILIREPEDKEFNSLVTLCQAYHYAFLYFDCHLLLVPDEMTTSEDDMLLYRFTGRANVH